MDLLQDKKTLVNVKKSTAASIRLSQVDEIIIKTVQLDIQMQHTEQYLILIGAVVIYGKIKEENHPVLCVKSTNLKEITLQSGRTSAPVNVKVR
jgi:hypothetical protein